MDINSRYAEIKTLTSKLKADILVLLTDRTKPLDERWAIYEKIPSDLLTEYSGGSLPFSNRLAKDYHPYSDGNMERGGKLDIASLLEWFEYDNEDEDSRFFGKFTPEVMVDIQEEILRRMMGKFYFQW